MSDIEKEIADISRKVDENNRILKSLQRRNRFLTIISVIKLIIIVSISFGIYKISMPVINSLIETYKKISESAIDIKNIKENKEIDSGFDISEIFGSN